MSETNRIFDIESALQDLPQWHYDDSGAISRSFTFAHFRDAWCFMSHVALLAEAADHHPDWSNSYNKVRIALKSHDAAAVIQRDIDLAKAIDSIKITS